MAVPLEKFVRQLEDSGILAGETLKDFVPPKAFPKDAEQLARELVRTKKLTKFQAEEISKGKGKSLTLGNYVLMGKIGAGGMGQVFKAEHRRMHRMVAIKLLPAALTKDKAAIARFEREVAAAAKLRHPNIVAADDADYANGVHFLAMELVEGSDLAALVKRNGPFAIEQSVDYILQAAKGLEFAHKKGVVHRDIKPANLLLDSEGTVKILDMGLARFSLDADEAPQADLTNTGTIMGTVDYMPPEQAEDTKTADARADIYALGCSLFYLLTGKATYDGETLMKKVLAHRNQPIPSLQSTLPEAPEQLDAIFKKMVAKRVEDRFQTMTEVIVALEGCSAGQAMTQTFQLPAQTALDQTSTLSSLQIHSAGSTIFSMPSVHLGWVKNGNNRKRALIGAAVLGAVILAVVFLFPRAKIKSGGEAESQVKSGPREDPVVTVTRKPLAFETPAFEAWVNDVSKMSDDMKVEAVSKKLTELNPGFDGKLVPLIDTGVIIGFRLFTDEVSDISPLRVFHGIKRLDCFASSPRRTGKLADLSPLKGMNLTFLNCGTNEVADLSPIQGMPLRVLGCNDTPLSDLKPISELPLEELWIGNTLVKDLSLLARIKTLRHIYACAPKVTSEEIAVLQEALPNCRIEWPVNGEFYVRPAKP